MPHKMVIMALAGAVGTLSRYGLSGFVHRVGISSFPAGTLVVNVSGCFIAGVLWTVFESRWPVSGETRTAIMLGFLGAFTTFSAYILETGELLRSAEWLLAALNLFLQTGLGLAALVAGVMLGRLA